MLHPRIVCHASERFVHNQSALCTTSAMQIPSTAEALIAKLGAETEGQRAQIRELADRHGDAQ